ncbi:prohormone-2-like [Macrosteles quadrilineatus]|uniref:prohormone-2-like n=1 Tax=Macrosteles quadrilineatus TaxID=74068 RepID=UPI0023E108C8|nr:prohormone-2-like [Macrosteles quadrilineatus]
MGWVGFGQHARVWESVSTLYPLGQPLASMSGLTLWLTVTVCVACVVAIPSSLLTDVKQAEMSHARLTNKVKRAQEVIMFGNQQNRGGDGRNAFSLPRAEKRGIDLEDGAMGESAPNGLAEAATEQPHEPYPPEDEVLEEPKVLAQSYRPLAELQNSVLKSEYFTDPASLTDLRYYDLDERRKRETFRTPSKRSSRGLTGRAKRDLDLDPEELLAILSYWENERRNKLQASRNMYNKYPVDNEDLEMLENSESGNELGDSEEPRQDGWYDGPVALPSHHFAAGPRTEMWPRQYSDDRRKRFMVSKRRPQM